jgi:hypothetical protein
VAILQVHFRNIMECSPNRVARIIVTFSLGNGERKKYKFVVTAKFPNIPRNTAGIFIGQLAILDSLPYSIYCLCFVLVSSYLMLYRVILYFHKTVLRKKFLFNNQPDALIIQIYSVIKIYMFRASSLPIIRSFLLYIRHW